MNKIITMSDGLEVEVEVREGELLEISSASVVDASLDKLKELLSKVITPVNDAYQTVSQTVALESAKVSVGVKFGVSGNVFVAKSSADASINIEMTFKAK
ncbi:hypothetical protein FFU48_12580 [Vibrio cholerae]|nr:hypothetical protein [Vibrio cholerae]EGR0611541.1 hypothetical protein [Vibrio cholerae]